MISKYHIVKNALRELYDVKTALLATLSHSCNFLFQILYRMKEPPCPSPLMTRRVEAQTFSYRNKRVHSAPRVGRLLTGPGPQRPRSHSQHGSSQYLWTLQTGTRESSIGRHCHSLLERL